MQVLIQPSILRGEMKAPPSKSMAHRMLICSGLSAGESRVSGVEPSEDVLATIDCLNALGAACELKDNVVYVKGIDPRKTRDPKELKCRECGSTLRFFVPICLLSGEETTLSGTEKLLSRPMAIYEDLCRDRGWEYHQDTEKLTVKGKLDSGVYRIPGNISSQFISGLLFALPLCEGDSRIELIPPVESRPYIDMTLEALELFGVKATWQDDCTIRIQGNQVYQAGDHEVEGDWSNAAFFEAFNYLGGSINQHGLKSDSLQGDKVCIPYFEKLTQDTPELDISDCPDLGPILIALAALLNGARLTGTKRLSMKESDRGHAMKEELRKFGIEIVVNENDILIPKAELKYPEEGPDSHNDHRIAMSLAVIETVVGGTIDRAETVRKSLPDFYERLSRLGAEVTISGMDQ